MKITLKRALSVILALCVLVASATCLMGVSVFAEEAYNVATKSLDGLSAEQKAERVLYSTQNSTAQGAAWMVFDGKDSDDNNKKWFTNNTTTPAWIIIDLNGYYSVSEISVSQHTGRYLKYKVYAANVLPGVEYSQTNATAVHDYIRDNGTVMVDRSSNTTKGGIISNTVSDVKARYVMIDITGTNNNIVIKEMQIMGVPYAPDYVTNTNDCKPVISTNVAYNYISGLSSHDEKMAAVLSNDSKNGPAYPYKAFDGVVASDSANENKWFSNGTPSAEAPQYLIVDLGAVYNISGLNITVHSVRVSTYTVHTITDLGDLEYKQGNEADIRDKIYNDGTQIIAQSSHSGAASYTLGGTEGRYVLLNATKCVQGSADQLTNIKEVEIYGYSLASATAKIDEAGKTITIPGGFGLTVNDLLSGLTVGGNAYVSIEKQGKDLLEEGDMLFVNHKAADTVTYLPGPTVYAIQTTKPNIALGKPVLGHGEPDKEGNPADGKPALAVNGELTYVDGTQWMVGGTAEDATDRPWLIIDLGDVYNLTSLMPYFASNTGYDYYVYTATEIAYAWNNDNKKAIAEAMMANAPAASDTTKTLGGSRVDLSATARYVLVKFGNRLGNASNTLSVYELEIFGYQFDVEDAVVDNDAKTITLPYSWGKNVDKDVLVANIASSNALVTVNQVGSYLASGDTVTLTYSMGATTGTKTYKIVVPSSVSIAYISNNTTNKVLASLTNTSPSNAFDGIINNNSNDDQWYAANTTGYIIIDLGNVYNLTSMNYYGRYNISGERTYTYDVYTVSELDGIDYTSEKKEEVAAALREKGTNLVRNGSNNKFSSHTFDEDACGRYVMIDITNSVGGSIVVAEIEIFGYAVASKTDSVVVDTDNNTVTVPFAWGDVSAKDALEYVNVLGNAYVTAKDDKFIVSTISGETIEFTVVKGKADDAFADAFVNSFNTASSNLAFYNENEQKITLSEAEVGDIVKVSFEYYTAGSQVYQLVFAGSATASSNESVRFSVGRNKFEQEITVTGKGDLTPEIKKLSGANAFYVWNVTVEINGVDQKVTYADTTTGAATYLTKDEASELLGLNLDEDHFVTKYDLSQINPNAMTENILVGAFMGSNVHIPANNEVTVSYDYFLPGSVAGVFATTAANNTSGNPAAAVEGKAVKYGYGHIEGTSAEEMSGAVSAMAAVSIKADGGVYADNFYVWNLKLETKDYGTITYIEVPQSQLNAYRNSSTDRGILSGYTLSKSATAVTAGEEVDYAYGDVADDFKYGDANFDNDVDICDLVYLNADNAYEDIRAFDNDKDAKKSDVDFAFVLDKIWAAFDF